jgi:hypothetical protein
MLLRKTVSSAMLVLLVLGMLAVTLGIQPASADVDWWPMFHHDPNHTGTSTSIGPTTNNLLWRYTTGGAVFSSPAIVGGLVYVGSEDGNVYCLNAVTGSLVWRYTTGGAVFSSPAVADGMVFIGSDDHNIYSLNEATGSRTWSWQTWSDVLPSPAVAGGFVLAGSSDGNVYDCNENTGITPWTDSCGDRYSSVAVADDMWFVGSYDHRFYAIDRSIGFLVWYYTTGGVVDSSPAVVNGIVYVGSDDGNIYAFGSTNQPPSTPVLSGPTLCTLYDGHDVYQGPWKYTASASDPDGDKIRILFSWDDGTPDEQSSLVPSGTPVQRSHSWYFVTGRNTGMHNLRAKAIDEHSVESGWSSPLEVTVVSSENDHEWGGYMAASLSPVVTISVEGKWVYPNYGAIPILSSQATWVGIGGNGKTKSLLQAGIMVWNPLGVPMTVPFYMTLNSGGTWTKTCGWEYLLSPPSPGDIIQTKITQIGYNQWQIYVKDVTKGWIPWMPTVTFQPDTTSAEWIHEPGASGGGIADFNWVTFQEARVTVNGNTYKVGNVDPSQVQSELILCNMKRNTAIVTNTSPISNYEIFTISDTGQRPTAVSPVTGISLHSSAILSVYDSSGNHLGYNSTSGFVDVQIPDSTYFEDEQGVQYALLFDAGAYRIELTGKGNGDFHLHVQTFYEETIVFDKWINGTTQEGKLDKYFLSVSPTGEARLTEAQIPVGGEWVPINRLQLVAPWISLISLMTVLTMSFVYVRRKRRQS